jgi:hypothetical protein
VLVQLAENDKSTIVAARRLDGEWKLELGGFVHGRDVPELTDKMRLQVDRTNEMTAALRTGDTKEVQRVMLKHIMDLRTPQPDSAATMPAATQPAGRGAKENPP